jgi:IS5 family transposase
MRNKIKDNTKYQQELFLIDLKDLIDEKHELVVLTKFIKWQNFYDIFGENYHINKGRKAIDTRLIVSLHYLKHLNNLSDREVVKQWTENPYWQHFSGMNHFCHKMPIHHSSMTRWRDKVSGEQLESMISEILHCGLRSSVIHPDEIEETYIDSTVQPKDIAFPTDIKSCNRMREIMVRLAKKDKITLRQNYNKISKKEIIIASRKRGKDKEKCIKKVKLTMGAVMRDIERNTAEKSSEMNEALAIANRLYLQTKESKNKVYSCHELDVNCIVKGKAGKPFGEYGCKVSVATSARNNWIIACSGLAGNPYDGHTVSSTIQQIQRITKVIPKNIYVDGGYKGHDYENAGNTDETKSKVFVDTVRKGDTDEILWKKMKRRARIEPIIGHLKARYGMGRCSLKGSKGDNVNAILSGAAMNLKKLLKAIVFFVFFWVGIFSGKVEKIISNVVEIFFWKSFRIKWQVSFS